MHFLYLQKEVSVDLMRHPEVKQFVSTTASVLNKAVDEGIRTTPPSDKMIESLKNSNLAFSGFKTFHQLNESFPSLLDTDGNRKPFEQFLKEVQTVDETYNSQYLKAEYNFAVASSQMAAKWEKFAADGDRYNLQYRTAYDDKVRDSHAKLHDITLPVNSPFWDEYFPPNGWGCRCTVVQVRKSKYPVSNEQDALNKGSQATTGKHQELFRFNPGKQQACYPAYNPYTIKKCTTCSKSSFKLVRVPDNELCAACKVIREIEANRMKIKIRRKELQEQAKIKLKGEKVIHPTSEKEVYFTNVGIKEFLNQPHKYYQEKNELITQMPAVLKEAVYKGRSDYHKENDYIIGNHIFEIELHGEKSWLIVRENKGGILEFYSISDSEKVLTGIKK